MFSRNKFNQTLILYFITVIFGLIFAAITGCGDADAKGAEYYPTAQEINSAPINPISPVYHADAAQCKATTKAGTQCSRKPSAGQSYCWQHGGTTKTEQAGAGNQVSGTCGAKTKAGGECKNRTKDGGKCHLHK